MTPIARRRLSHIFSLSRLPLIHRSAQMLAPEYCLLSPSPPQLLHEAHRQATTSSSVEPGMVFMRCTDNEDPPGARPLMYGIRPNEDLALFNEVEGAQDTQRKSGVKHRAPTEDGVNVTQCSTAQGLEAGNNAAPCSSSLPRDEGRASDCHSHSMSSQSGPTAWSTTAEQQKLHPFLFLAARDLHGQACSLSPSVAAQVHIDPVRGVQWPFCER